MVCSYEWETVSSVVLWPFPEWSRVAVGVVQRNSEQWALCPWWASALSPLLPASSWPEMWGPHMQLLLVVTAVSGQKLLNVLCTQPNHLPSLGNLQKTIVALEQPERLGSQSWACILASTSLALRQVHCPTKGLLFSSLSHDLPGTRLLPLHRLLWRVWVSMV